MFAGMVRSLPSGWSLAIGPKLMTATNTLAYYGAELITTVKSLFESGPWGIAVFVLAK
jgi:hypothetical protein